MQNEFKPGKQTIAEIIGREYSKQKLTPPIFGVDTDQPMKKVLAETIAKINAPKKNFLNRIYSFIF